jgi:type II secretory pathway component PulF
LFKIRTLILQNKQLDNLPYILITIAALWCSWQIITTKKSGTILSFLYLHAPIAGRLLRTRYFYHLSFYLSLLPKKASMAVEQKLIETLPFVKSSLVNLYMQNFLDQTVIILKKGGRLSDFWRLPTKNFSFKMFQGQLNRQSIPVVFRRLVEIGEKTNTLHLEFHHCSIILREELETEIKFTLSYFEPIFILLIALLVSLTAISLYSLISQVYSQTG